MLSMRALVVAAAALAVLTGTSQGFQIPANNIAQESGRNGTAAGTEALAMIGTANATLLGLAELLLAAHDAAEYSYVTSYAGQQSGTLAAVAAAGASLLASTIALNNQTSAVPEARSALAAANQLLGRIVDENPTQNSNATNANLLLAYQIAHDGTLAQYFQNETGGEAMDNATLAETVEFAAGLGDWASEQLAGGASPALASVAAEIVARNLLSAIYTYEGNNSLAYQQGLAEARLILKAANILQSGAACGGSDSTTYLSQASMAVQAATRAAETLSSADINAARQAALVVVPLCGSLTGAGSGISDSKPWT